MGNGSPVLVQLVAHAERVVGVLVVGGSLLGQLGDYTVRLAFCKGSVGNEKMYGVEISSTVAAVCRSSKVNT